MLDVVGVVFDDVCVEVEDCVPDVVAAFPVEVDDVVGVVFIEVDVELVVPALAELLGPAMLTGVVHQLVAKVVVVLPEVCDPVTVTGGVTVVGLELVAVLDELWVLAVPPLMVG